MSHRWVIQSSWPLFLGGIWLVITILLFAATSAPIWFKVAASIGCAFAGVAVLLRVESESSETKFCPDCAEIVRAPARVCKHCGYRFDY